MASVDHGGEHDVEDPSGLVAKLRALVGRGGNGERSNFQDRVFGSPAFFRLWLSQAIASTGDWLGFLAILILAGRIGLASGQQGTSIGLVMAARIVPGLFFSAPAGVLIDRMDRKQVMVVTTLMRAAVVATLPFVDSVLGLVFASFVLELAALLFQPAKEATVPHLVPADRLTSANSLGLAAAYGTFPLASILFALLAKVAEWLGSVEVLDALKTSQEAVAFYVQVGCYLVAGLIIARLAIPKDHVRVQDEEPIDLGAFFIEVKEGWHFAFINPVVRAVNVGLATGLIGGGMLVPLGDTFAREVLGAGASGYGVFIAALGVGVGAGIIGVSARQASIHKERAFVASVFGAGIALLVGVSTSTLGLAALTVTVMGIFAGSSYVLGFTLLHEHVDDELRGRVFAGTYILVRVCVLVAMAIGPMLVDPLDGVSNWVFGDDRRVELGLQVSVPGVRLTLWLAGVIMLAASALAALSLRTVRSQHPAAGKGRGDADDAGDAGGTGSGGGDAGGGGGRGGAGGAGGAGGSGDGGDGSAAAGPGGPVEPTETATA
jgi:dTMP kinase